MTILCFSSAMTNYVCPNSCHHIFKGYCFPQHCGSKTIIFSHPHSNTMYNMDFVLGNERPTISHSGGERFWIHFCCKINWSSLSERFLPHNLFATFSVWWITPRQKQCMAGSWAFLLALTFPMAWISLTFHAWMALWHLVKEISWSAELSRPKPENTDE